MTNSVEVITFGCRLNAYESEVIKKQATQAGWTNSVIINSCAVTHEAERQAKQTIRKLRRQNPTLKIVMTGCAAQIDPQKYALMPEIDLIIGNQEKLLLETYEKVQDKRVMVGDIMTLRETASHLISGYDGKTRAFIEIQQGCDHRCTFCIIPFGRGNNRSVPLAHIRQQIRDLLEKGYQEIVLTGVDIASYGTDYPESTNLGSLVLSILSEIPDLPRLRLSSLDPIALDKNLQKAIAEDSRLMPHFHLSVQAGNDMILKRMKRRHSRQDVVDLSQTLRSLRPDIALGADLIAGFPTENDEMFQETLALIEEAGLTHLHIFPFSPRPGTPAAKMPQLAPSLIKQRAQDLRQKGQKSLKAFMKTRLGTIAQVLVEKEDKGHCEHFLTISLRQKAIPGSLIPVKISDLQGSSLIGDVL
jgi:threonylcarbamoyladenosine tRNA methylthiotransferase MtaB